MGDLNFKQVIKRAEKYFCSDIDFEAKAERIAPQSYTPSRREVEKIRTRFIV